MINDIRGRKTETWTVGWTDGNNLFLLDRKSFETESSHKYSDEYYESLIKHELSHLFFGAITGGAYRPIWLNEGVSIYTSGQNKFKKRPTKFSNLLEFFEHGGKGAYVEPGFFIEGLVNKFGKEKLLNFIKDWSKLKTREEFERLFEKTYGFKLFISL